MYRSTGGFCINRYVSRRNVLRSAALATTLLSGAQTPATAARRGAGQVERSKWVAMLTRVAEPVIASLAANTLKARMPIECPAGDPAERSRVTHLEALGRTLCGLAPWLEAQSLGAGEEKQRARFADLARQALVKAVDPASPDHIDFTAGPQNVVDAAFLASALSRGRKQLWDALDNSTRERMVAVLQSTRQFPLPQSNWLLFASIIEAFLASVGAEWQAERIDKAVTAHEAWYKGDGAYGDGPSFHWDYYNSYVIQPFYIETLDLIAPVADKWAGLRGSVMQRAHRYAAIQERMIAPDGSYPPLGRSITYRCGAFHHLAMMAWRHELPQELAPAQVRGALSAVIHRTLGAPETFDAKGWLRIGLAGAQPQLAERYISTGSLYLCTLAFLPLGLAPADPFWSAPPEDWTAKKLWSGKNLSADHAAD
jgi:hypothetical protein